MFLGVRCLILKFPRKSGDLSAKRLHDKEATFCKIFHGIRWKRLFRLSNNGNPGVSVLYKEPGFILQLKLILAERQNCKW